MDLTFGNILTLVLVGGFFWFLTIAFILFGVTMGAYFVFRTKKEAYEPFLKTPKGEVFSLETKEEPEEEVIMPESILGRTNDFISQLGGK